MDHKLLNNALHEKLNRATFNVDMAVSTCGGEI